MCAWRCSGAGAGAAGGGAGGVAGAGGGAGGAGGARTHDAQLEELRHAQARLTADRAAWEAHKAADYASIAAGKINTLYRY